MRAPFFPITMRELSARMIINKLSDMKFSLGKVQVHAALVNHPGVCAGYRIFTSAGSVAFLPDYEPYEFFLHALRGNRLSSEQAKEIAADEQAGLVRFLRGSDILILDGQYTDEEYKKHIGWGHSSISSAVSLALEADIQTLVLFHHDPHHDDEKVGAMLESARKLVAKTGKPLKVEAAQEGAEILLDAKLAVA
jgi:phosphoribosyl 1,2-cyclic phosphodiesterase